MSNRRKVRGRGQRQGQGCGCEYRWLHLLDDPECFLCGQLMPMVEMHEDGERYTVGLWFPTSKEAGELLTVSAGCACEEERDVSALVAESPGDALRMLTV